MTSGPALAVVATSHREGYVIAVNERGEHALVTRASPDLIPLDAEAVRRLGHDASLREPEVTSFASAISLYVALCESYAIAWLREAFGDLSNGSFSAPVRPTIAAGAEHVLGKNHVVRPFLRELVVDASPDDGAVARLFAAVDPRAQPILASALAPFALEVFSAAKRVAAAELDDVPLVLCARLGSGAAWRVIDQRYRAAVRAVVGRNGAIRGAELDDVTQNVFLRAFAGLIRFRHEAYSRLQPWLARIAMNEAARHLTQRTRSARTSAPLDDDELAQVPDPATVDDVPVAEEITAERARDVYAALARLSRPLRDTLQACVIDGIDYETYARSQGIAYSTVAVRVKRAKEKLMLELALARAK